MYYLLILGRLFKNAFIYGWFFSPQTCNTAYSIFILCWWSCFLLQWKIEGNVKQVTHTPPSHLRTYIHLCPQTLPSPMTTDGTSVLCAPLLAYQTPTLLPTQVHFPAVIPSWWWTGRPGMLRFMGSRRVGHDWATDLIWSLLVLGTSFLVFSLEQHPSAYKTPQVSQRIPATLQPVLSSAPE